MRFQVALPELVGSCSPLVLSGDRHFDGGAFVGARPVAFENDAGIGLWVLPGPLSDSLQAAGFVLPSASPTVLPDPACLSALVVSGLPGTLRAGSMTRLDVSVTHTDGGSPWPDARSLGGVGGAVRLALEWDDPSRSDAPVVATLQDLPETVLPGETVRVPIDLRAADDAGRPLAGGDYDVRVELVQQGFRPFDTCGGAVARFRTHVQAHGG
jgi:hypothetical protein